jgi:hypothetical protein
VFRRRKERRTHQADQSPVVFDRDGVPVGVRVPNRANPEEATKAGRYHARLAALKKTHELDQQYRMRVQSCLFCSAPPS